MQGLADVFAELRTPYDSVPRAHLNSRIFETIYHGALTASCHLAREHGPYESYSGSPANQGLLQPTSGRAGRRRRSTGRPSALWTGPTSAPRSPATGCATAC